MSPCRWAGSNDWHNEVSRGNKDSGTGLRLEVTSSLVKEWGNGIHRPGSAPRQREERGRFANG